jgi:phage tail P2-like protein
VSTDTVSADSLLPPNATVLETALALTGTRLSDIVLPLEDLWNPLTCPATALPWLAWSLSVDAWNAEWSDERKRAATAQAIATHRRKGSVTVVREALAAIDTLARLIEWHEASPRLTPHTAQIRLPVVDAEGVAGGTRCSAATTAQILADVTRVAPVRTHFEVVLDLGSATSSALRGAGQAALYRRAGASGIDTSGIPGRR